MSLALNKSAVLDFIDFGLVRPGDHFFFRGELDLDREVLSYVQQGGFLERPDPRHVAQTVFGFLEQAVHQIIAENHVDAFALSGGADSRLILEILRKNHPQFLKQTYIYCRIHPSLGEERDRDYLLARAISERLGLKLNAETADQHSQFYLNPMNDCFTVPLSGLWGTELLGGTIITDKLFSKKDLVTFARSEDSDLLSYIKRSLDTLENYELSEYFLLYRIFRETQASAFYRSLSWYLPSAGLQRCRTPFISGELVKFLGHIPSGMLTHYKLYSQILETFCSDLIQIPINNQSLSSSLTNDLRNWGVEPMDVKVSNNLKESLGEEEAMIRELVKAHPTARYSDYLLKILPYLGYFREFQTSENS